MLPRSFSSFPARAATIAAALAITALALPADAHSILVSPPPIGPDPGAKAGPCGCYFGAAPEDPNDPNPQPCPVNYTVTTLEAGSQVEIQWKETVNHDGKFRFAFSSKPPEQVKKADMDAGVLVEIPDTNSVAGTTLKQMITVPDKPCDLCTIQLRQLMLNAPNPYYYSCAAVKIVSPGAGSSSAGAGASGGAGGTGGAAGAGAGASGGAGGAGQGASSGQGALGGSTGAGRAEQQPPVASSCSASSTPAGGAPFVPLAIAAFSLAAARRRRLLRAA
jgi:hypothetical protein